MAAKKRDATRIVGDPVLIDLETVKPNDWNPNRMSTFQKASLREGLQKDGWLMSQSMTVWGTNEKGKKQNVIIDGEHRFEEAKKLGFKRGPAVFLNGLTREQAIALTIKLDGKHGQSNHERLVAAVDFIRRKEGEENLALELGIAQQELATLVHIPEVEIPTGGATEYVKMVQLLFKEKDYDDFSRALTQLAKKYKTKDVSATVLEVLRHVR